MSAGLFDAPMLPMPGMETGDRREFDSYYTPDHLAEKLVSLLPIPERARIVEPSVGGGAWARALRKLHPTCHLTGVDVDEDARGFGFVDEAIRGVDWDSDDARLTQSWDWCIGNPPFNQGQNHAQRSMQRAVDVAFVLPLPFLCAAERFDLHDEHPLRRTFPLVERVPFTGSGGAQQDCAFFWWRRGYRGENMCTPVSWAGPILRVAGRRTHLAPKAVSA